MNEQVGDILYVDKAVAQRAVVYLPHGSEELPEEVDLPEDNCQSVSLCSNSFRFV